MVLTAQISLQYYKVISIGLTVLRVLQNMLYVINVMTALTARPGTEVVRMFVRVVAAHAFLATIAPAMTKSVCMIMAGGAILRTG